MLGSYRLPLFLVLLSTPFVIISRITGSDYIESIIPELLIICVYVLLLVLKNLKVYSISILITVLALCFFISFIHSFYSETRFGLYGGISILITTYIFYSIFMKYKAYITPEVIYGHVGIVLFIHISYIFFENLAVLLDFRDYFVQYLPRYRNLTSVFGSGNYVANSLYATPQAASIISIISFIWFYDYFNITNKKMFFNRKLVIIATFLIAIYNMSMTSLLIFVVIFYIMNYFFNNGKNVILIRFLILLSFIIIYFYSTNAFEIIFYKISNDNKFNYYLMTTLSSIFYFLELPFIYQLFGTGDLANSVIPSDIAHLEYPRTEFGFGMILVKGGLLLTGITMAIILKTSIGVLKIYKKSVMRKIKTSWISVILSLYIVFLISFFSTIHYSTVVNPGYRILLSYLLAYLVFSLKYYTTILKYNAK
jgi:hypothetical protein